MKRAVFSLSAALAVVLACATVCTGAKQPKLIVFFSPENPAAVRSAARADGLFDDRLIPVEHRLAEALAEKGWQVLTAGDLSASSELSTAQIGAANQGNFKQIRRAAIANSAHFIFSGFLDASVSDTEAAGMKLKKVVTVVSHKLYDTVSAKALDVATETFTDVGRSPKQLFGNTLKQMAAEISTRLDEKLPKEISAKQARALAALRREMGAAEAAAEDYGTDAGRAPQIVIINPPLGRGFAIARKRRAVDMEGMVIDHTGSGIKSFKINREPVALNPSGEFTYAIMLDPGDNRFELAAVTNNGRMVEKSITLTLADDRKPPDIQIIEPLITRGFTTIVKDPVSRLKVKGQALDESEIQYVHVNGTPAPIDQKGRFATELGLSGGQTTVAIVSADIFGNTAEKKFHVEKGGRGPASASGSAGDPTGGYKPVLWGLGVGVSKYSSRIPDLKYAAADVRSMARFFESQEGRLFSEVHFNVLTDQEVTRDSIIEHMTAHLGQAGPDDVVFLFIAGHGIKHRQTGSYYFVPADADNSTIVSRGLRMSDFEEAVNILAKNVEKVIIAMDTCHSGAMEIGLRSAMSSENLAKALKEASGLYILSASKGGEVSMEGEEFQIPGSDSGHGVFTYALITGMQGEANYDGDTVITLNELFQYVSRKVPRLTKGRQHPYLRVSGTDMPLVVTGP